MLQRAHDLADGLDGDTGIERGGIEPGVTKQHLDHSNIDVTSDCNGTIHHQATGPRSGPREPSEPMRQQF